MLKIFFTYFLLLFISINSQSQLSPAQALNKLYNDYPQEKIYLWQNKPAYIAGETIFFKAYIFSGYDLSRISSNLYVEFLNKEKKSISLKRYPLLKGVTTGSIELDSTLAEDFYYIRSYTDWMLNFDESFQYIKLIPVYNQSSKFKLEKNDDDWELGVFPEGGNLIEGFTTKVALRLLSAGKLPEKWEGYVMDNDGNKISNIDVLDQNAGLFNITPQAGINYKVVVTDGSGKLKSVNVPAAKTSGAGMNILNKDSVIFIDIRYKNVPGNGTGNTLIGHVQNQLVYEAKIKSSTESIQQTIQIPGNINGILHLTLFDNENTPVSERLVFLNPDKLIYDSTIQFETVLNTSPREENEMTLTLDTANWNSYGISILDNDLPGAPQEENLLSSLWLTSDLSSSVHNAASYFNSIDKKKIDALDAILISEKWKRFDWKNILLSRFPLIKYKPQNFLSFSGVIKAKKDIMPHEGISFLIGNPGTQSQFVYTETDSINKVHIDNILYSGSFFSYYRLNNGKKFAGKKIDVSFTRNDIYEPFKGTLPAAGFALKPASETKEQPAWIKYEMDILREQKNMDLRYKTLQEVLIKSSFKKKSEILQDKLVSGRFKISNDYIFDFVNEKQNALASPTIFHWLQGKVSGLEALYSPRSYTWVPVYKRFSQTSNHGVLLFLNEGETTAEWLNFVPMDNIIMIKVITSPRSLAFGNNIGLVISVYLERDSIVPAEREMEFRNKALNGYDIPATYSFPNYDQDKNLSLKEKDNRRELLWQPVLFTDDSLLKTNIKFFNNDSVKTIRILIQGFNNEGYPVYIDRIIKSDAKKVF